MKKIALLLVTIILAAGCGAKKTSAPEKNADVVSFEYEAMTRGNYKKVIVTQDSIITIKDYKMEDVVKNTTTTAEWNTLMDALAKVDLEGMETITPPSKKHQFDGALAAYLKVIKSGETYRSATFDHGNPPAELKTIVDKIVAISDMPKRK